MRRYFYETISELPPEQLFRAMADVRRWPEWDDEIEAVEIEGPAEAGVTFALKPRGRDAVKLCIETMVEPFRFTDLAYLPLARMRTEHSFIPTSEGTLVRHAVEISGLLAAFWDRPLAQSYEEGTIRQTRRFLAFAASWRETPQPAPTLRRARPLPNYVFC